MKIEYGRKRYHNMSEEEKERLKEYQKKYYEKKKLWFLVKHCILIDFQFYRFNSICSSHVLFIKSVAFMYSKLA